MRGLGLFLLLLGCSAEIEQPSADEASLTTEPSPNPIVNGGFEHSNQGWSFVFPSTLQQLDSGRSGRSSIFFGPTLDNPYGGTPHGSWLTSKPFTVAANATSTLIFFCESVPSDDKNVILKLHAQVTDVASGQILAQADDPCALKAWSMNALRFDGAGKQLVVSFHGADVLLDDVAVDQASVKILSPADGAKVSGTITISAEASDIFLPPRVGAMMDNFVLGSGAKTFTQKFDTTQMANGPHVIAVSTSDQGGGKMTALAHIDIENTIDTGAIADGSFESGSFGAWQHSGNVSIVGSSPHRDAVFNTPRQDYGYDRLWQTITVPAGAALTFTYLSRCGWTSYEDSRAEILSATQTVLSSLSTCNYNNAWNTASIDLSAWSGQKVTVRFSARFWYTQSVLYVDDVEVR